MTTNTVPKGFMLVPIELVREVVDHISSGHDHCDESLELLKLVQAAETSTKPKES